jgi:sulfite exporter TauE/SafE
LEDCNYAFKEMDKMNDFDVYSMIMLGLLGTGHCLAMCGPLVFAFPASTGRFSPHLFYHLGRAITYIVIGGLMGAMGAVLAEIASTTGADPAVWIAPIQIGLGLVAALFLFVFGLSRLGIIPEPKWLSIASPDKIPGYRKIVKSAALQKRQADMLMLGLMLGLLPCGLSYAAFARALPAGGMLKGAILVAAFAIGTVPGLLILGTGASKIVQRYRKQSDILAGLLMLYMAIKLGLKAGRVLLG